MREGLTVTAGTAGLGAAVVPGACVGLPPGGGAGAGAGEVVPTDGEGLAVGGGAVVDVGEAWHPGNGSSTTGPQGPAWAGVAAAGTAQRMNASAAVALPSFPAFGCVADRRFLPYRHPGRHGDSRAVEGAGIGRGS
ncbi:hypothetical protein ASG71_08750 [Arthrobacter sp. Soil763]|nr:hypothetical protein ASG71_08750 [Arthrobacter sp. Soil763]